MVDKRKDPGQVLIDLRAKFREATSVGLLSGEQKSLFELTLISLVNEAEEQRQKCLRIKLDHEREAARAEAQASSFHMVENLIYTVFGNIVNKVKTAREEEQKEDEEEEKEKEELSEEEKKSLAELEKRQEIAKTRRSKKARAKKATTKKS